MESMILILLVITVGGLFAWHRIKIRGLATVLEDVWHFIATQNSKDVATYRATWRAVLRLRNRLDEYGAKLDERHQQKKEAGLTNQPPGFYKNDEGSRYYWDGQERRYRDYKGRKWNHSRQREKSVNGDWINWMDRNVHPNTPPWMQSTNRAIYEWLLMMAVIFVIGTVLIILLIVAVNMG